ncbi:MAG: esterase [Candidatus Melainabacteria bacterium]|nr:esterase [Candidatus Melainabacteria bacterium]
MRKLLFQGVPVFLSLLVLGLACAPAPARNPLLGRKSQFWQGSGSMRKESLKVGGVERTYYVYSPRGFEAGSGPLPLVIALHGGGGTAERMDKLTGGITRVADRNGFLIAFPQGEQKRWNDGRKAESITGSLDDVGFIAQMIDTLVGSGKVDSKRVYATGISNGGFFSQYLAIKLPDRIAAVATVAATVPASWQSESPGRPVPVMMILGLEDPLVPYNGGRIGGRILHKDRGSVLPAGQSISYWLDNNSVDRSSRRENRIDNDPDDGTSLVVSTFGQAADKKQVMVVDVRGGGHTWPRGWKYLPEALIGRTSQELDANEAIWNFFRSHSL